MVLVESSDRFMVVAANVGMTVRRDEGRSKASNLSLYEYPFEPLIGLVL